MSTWKTTYQAVKNDIGNWINSGVNQVKDLFGNTANKTIAEVESLFKNGSTVVGINVNQIDSMKQAIRNYVDNLQKTLDKLDAVDPNVAFKGEVNTAIVEYINAVKTACQAVVSNMLAFNDQLTKVQEAYLAKDDELKSKITADADTTRSSFKAYSEGTN